ncbi:hypothetical protein [Flavobacterium sp. LB2P53]|uniref:hypothetical protein n=1 Tax=Flavobacterium sp. LB2P53 TaxID=2497481 RepID=UPI000F8203D5|nr:hypothetical protein [Flavobacterium sp. LB2P53]RTY65547.1 hypothetical protein EKL95_12760 [Flavobacterium sp. LB2P53]
MNPKKQFNRYIPSLIKDELDQLTHPRKDNLYTIIDLINRKEIYYKSDLQRTYGYTEIALAQFKELLPTSNNLNEDIQFLIDNNFIRRNNFYTIGAKCKSYKISSEYLGKTIGIKIQNININKRIAKQIEKNKRMKVKSLEFAKSEYYKTFKVDIDGANKAILNKTIQEFKNLCLSLEFILSEKQMRDIIDCKKESLKNRMLIIIRKEGKELHDILHRYMIYSTRINAINDGFLFFKRNKTNGRLDSNLTSLPSFLRPFIISNEPLMNVDIKNSQPYFLYTLIQNKPEIDTEELSKYKDLVIDGTIYEFLVKKYKIYTGIERTRNQMKEMLFKVYYSKNSSFEKLKQFFGWQFPSIMAYINKTNSVEHNTLSIQLQTIESYSILDVIMPLLEEKGIRPFTIHDSFVCKESETKTIEEVFTKKLIELYGIAPSLHLDYIEKVEDDEDDEKTVFDDAFFDEMNSWDDDESNDY